MRLISVPDLTGDGAVHCLADLIIAGRGSIPTPPLVRAIIFASTTANKTSRIGDDTVSASCGFPFSDQSACPYVPSTFGPATWNLTEVFVYAGTGDNISITYIVD